MKIKMLNTTITLAYKYESTKDTDMIYSYYDTEFIIQSDDDTIGFAQINSLISSFCRLTDTNSKGEMYTDKLMITHNKTNKRGTFIVKVCLVDEICFDEFMCKTDDFKTFEWYARKIVIEEKTEFQPIK